VASTGRRGGASNPREKGQIILLMKKSSGGWSWKGHEGGGGTEGPSRLELRDRRTLI